MASTDKPRLHLRDLLFRIDTSTYSFPEEQRLALFKTKAGENLFLDRAFDVFDEKKNGVIEFEEFVHALSVFHPYAPLEDKIDFAFRLYDLRQTGYMERDEVRQMVALQESSIQVPDETLEAIVDKTFEDADAKEDERISKRRMESFCHSESGPPEEHDTSILERCHNSFPKFYFQHRSRRLKTLAKPYGIDRKTLQPAHSIFEG